MDIRVPHLADGVDSGTVVNILVNEGDQVQKDQTLVELETEKAVAAIPAPQSGTVTRINIKKDDKVAVGQVLMTISEAGAGKPSGNGHSHHAAETEARPAPREAVARESARPQAPAPRAPAAPPRRLPAGIPEPASPTVRRIAEELGIDLSRVHGSEH